MSMRQRFQRPTPSSKGLVGWWKMYDGTVLDYSSNDNNGTLAGTSLVYDYPGLNLAGDDEYIDTGSAFQSTFRASWSASIWVKPDDGRPAALEYLLGTANGTAQDRVYVAVLASGDIRFLVASNGATVFHDSDNMVFTNGQQTWHHIVVVAIADTSLRVYFDGIDEGSTDASGLTFADWTSADEVFIGALDNTGTDTGHFAGKLDDVRLFNVAKSAEEARNLFELTRWRYGV